MALSGRLVCVLLASTLWCTAGTAIAASSAPAAAKAPAPGAAAKEEAWLRADTPDFTLYGQVGEARLRAIASRLESFRFALERLHPEARTSPRETSVFVFRDAASGRRYAPAPSGGGEHLAVDAPYDVPNYITVAAPRDDPPLEVLYHAYSHQFLDDNFPHLPLAVAEGLAEFYSGFVVSDGNVYIGGAKANHLSWLKDHPPTPLADLFAVDRESLRLAEAPRRAAFMAGSWTLMHDLVAGSDANRARLPVFLKTLRRGAPPAEAVLAAYGLSLDRLQAEVSGYVARGRFLPLLAGQEPQDDPIVQKARAVGPDEIEAALGELLAHAGADRTAEAEALLLEAARLNPSQARAYRGLGYLRYSQSRLGEAVSYLEKANGIGADAMSCYLLARALLLTHAGAAPASGAAATALPATAASGAPAALLTPPWLARARELLARAIALRPRFAAPYVELGATHIRPDGDVAAGIDLLQKALAMLPARMDIAGNLVYLYLRKGDPGRAQALINDPLAEGGDAGALQSARQALAAYRENLAAKQSLASAAPTAVQKAQQGRQDASMVKTLQNLLAETQDPERRAKIEALLKSYESGTRSPDYNAQVAIYNEAVDRANRRDYAGAIALLENLLPSVKTTDLVEQIKQTLERFRQDAARLQQPAK